VGKLGLAAVLDHPEFELAALIVHSPNKIGVDAGELVGRPTVGVTATDDVDGALAVDADAVAYLAEGDQRAPEAVADMVRALRAGRDVVSCSICTLVHPRSAPRELVEPLEAACRQSGRSVFVTGIEPGAFSDLLPLTLMGMCTRVSKVRVFEIADWSTFDNPKLMLGAGFGQPLDFEPPFLTPGSLSRIWHGPIEAMAEGMGVELEGIREGSERLPATRDIELPGSLGRIEQGTQAALHFVIEGIVGGEPRISVEHFNRMGDDQAPEWPRIPGGDGYKIMIDGDPILDLQISVRGSAGGDFNTGACLVTAWRAIGAIPAVQAARPGLLTALDLPLITGRGNMY
jgi:4-hydroxy-tetrahydrodipicolinate reductase